MDRVSLQNDPAGQGLSLVEPTGQYEPAEHSAFFVVFVQYLPGSHLFTELALQTYPGDAHVIMFAGLLQSVSAGQSCCSAEFARQYIPSSHSLGPLDPSGQYVPIRHASGSGTFTHHDPGPWHSKDGSSTGIMFDRLPPDTWIVPSAHVWPSATHSATTSGGEQYEPLGQITGADRLPAQIWPIGHTLMS